jgi:2'-5' RNA ligase
MKRRVFIAINATDPLSFSFLPTLKKLKINADRSEMNVRWVPLENYHVTISFLGDKSPEEISEIHKQIQKVCDNTHPFELKIEDMSAFSNEHDARTLWLGVQNKKHLGSLKENLDQSIKDVSYASPIAERPFKPHLTIARLRNPGSVKDMISPFKRKSFGKIQVSEVVLYESKLKGPFPIYVPLARFKLTGEQRPFTVEPLSHEFQT